jgi:hypothetical protein
MKLYGSQMKKQCEYEKETRVDIESAGSDFR